MKQYQSKHTAALSSRGFYTILTVCALIIAASAWVLWSTATAPNADSTADAPVITPAEQLPDLHVDTPVLHEEEAAAPENKAQDSGAPDTTDADSAAPAPSPTVTVSAPVFVRPVSGNVITPFSGDELLFQPTFGDWRVHTGTDFAAAAGENVLALTDGTVRDVSEDGLYGTCVTLAHDAGLTTTYRGLTDVRVTAGQAIAAGEAIGAVAQSIDAEAALGPHLHVEAMRADTAVDVLELLGESETE